MEHDERLENYAYFDAARGRQLVYELSDDNPLLTPAQRRRLRHKRNSPKTHSHGLPEYEENGYLRREPCPRCRTRPVVRRVGGVRQ